MPKLIVDTNCMAETFSGTCSADLRLVRDCLLSGAGVLTYGGSKLTEEYARIDNVRRVLLRLDQAGRAQKVTRQLVDNEEAVIRALHICKSDDEHIIALARISGARVLCSKDQALHADFKNLTLIAPKGAVYQKAAHKKLLR